MYGAERVSTPPFPESPIAAVNVASVPQRSPLRYPGGKTWLVPHIRHWLGTGGPVPLIVEPFAGGGIVSLTAVMEGCAEEALMVELDRDVSAFWRAALRQTDELVELVSTFAPTRDNIEALANDPPLSVLEQGFRTLVLNRTRRGGVLAPGAALIRHGESGNGVASRWYPDTLVKRLRAIAQHANQIHFVEGDGVALLSMMSTIKGARFFVDPPYTTRGGKRAGRRLYAHNEVDHSRIFKSVADVDFMMTYDCSEEIVGLVAEHGYHAVHVNMKSGHHATLAELVISPQPLF